MNRFYLEKTIKDIDELMKSKRTRAERTFLIKWKADCKKELKILNKITFIVDKK